MSRRSRRVGQRSDHKVTLVCTDRRRHDPMTVGYAFWNDENAYTRGIPGRVQFRNSGKQRTYTHPGRSPEDIADMRRVGQMRTETMVCPRCPLTVPMTRTKWQPFVLRRGAEGATRIDLSLEGPIAGVDFAPSSSQG